MHPATSKAHTSEVPFRLCANTDPQRNSIFTKGPSDELDHVTSEIASGSKLGIDATKKLPGEGFKRHWPPLMDRLILKECAVTVEQLADLLALLLLPPLRNSNEDHRHRSRLVLLDRLANSSCLC